MHTTQTSLLWAVRDPADREAWISFYRIYAPMIRQFARRMGLSEADSEDVLQEVMVLAHRSLRDGGYDPARGRFRNWLYGIARNRSLMALRARRRRTRVQCTACGDGPDVLGQIEDPAGDQAAAEIWRQEWRYALLGAALEHVRAEVGGKTFEAFVDHAIHRVPVETVAARLGIAPSSVYVYKGRVLEAIREWLARFEDVPDE